MKKGVTHYIKYAVILISLNLVDIARAQDQGAPPSTINSQTEFQNWLNGSAQTPTTPKVPQVASSNTVTTTERTQTPPTSSTSVTTESSSLPPLTSTNTAVTSSPPPLTATNTAITSTSTSTNTTVSSSPSSVTSSTTPPAPLGSAASNTQSMEAALEKAASAANLPPGVVPGAATIKSSFPPTQLATAEPGPVTEVQTTTIKKTITKPRVRIRPILPSPTCDSPVISGPLSYRQSQKIMLQAAPTTPKADADSEAAFAAMMKQNVPLSPQQVVRMRQIIDSSQRAASIPPTVPPKPVSSTLIINLAPGATPPAIRLAQNYVSSLVFVDSTGSPWPVASYDIGDPKSTNIQWDGKSNILLMQAITPYSAGNLVIRLVGLPTPVTLELVSGQRDVDFRTDIHVPGLGPNAIDSPVGVGLPESANQMLLGVLDGVAPPGSKILTVAGGGECQAWLLGDKMFLRTRFTVLSPGWIGKMSSPDGMYAYEMQRTSSVLISQYGDPVEMKIEGF